jgi:hypothetical protein
MDRWVVISEEEEMSLRRGGHVEIRAGRGAIVDAKGALRFMKLFASFTSPCLYYLPIGR